MYEWWGKDEMHTFEQIKEFIKYSLQESRLPQTYGAFINTGICRKLMESAKENARNNINSNELWLYTKHINLYEKFEIYF